MSQANHFAANKPCVILHVKDPDNPEVLSDDNGKPMVFACHDDARRHAANNLEAEYAPFVRYVNENPVMNAGDREETNNRKCLKCGGFLRLGKDSASTLPDGSVLALNVLDCPKCDLGEK